MMTIEDVLVMGTLGFEFELNDGKITGIIGTEDRRHRTYL